MFQLSFARFGVLLTGLWLVTSNAYSQEKRTALSLFSDTCLKQIESYEALSLNMKAIGWRTVAENINPLLSIAVGNIRRPRTFSQGDQSITVQSRVLDVYEHDGAGGPVFAIINRLEHGSNDITNVRNVCQVFDFNAKYVPKENDWDDATLLKVLNYGSALQYRVIIYRLYADAQVREAIGDRGSRMRMAEHKNLKGLVMRVSGFLK